MEGLTKFHYKKKKEERRNETYTYQTHTHVFFLVYTRVFLGFVFHMLYYSFFVEFFPFYWKCLFFAFSPFFSQLFVSCLSLSLFSPLVLLVCRSAFEPFLPIRSPLHSLVSFSIPFYSFLVLLLLLLAFCVRFRAVYMGVWGCGACVRKT